MSTFTDSLTRMRRMLRDPDGNIWSDGDILTYFNDSQLEVAQKTGLHIRVDAYPYPPEITWSHVWDWEREYLEGDELQVMIMSQTQTDGEAITYPWESAWYFTSIATADDGHRFTHPFESVYCSPADAVPIPLHARFEKMHLLAFDKLKLDPVTERELAASDPFYRTRTGLAQSYYPVDEYRNQIVLYPRPSAINWQETDLIDIFDDSGELLADEDFFDMVDTGVGIEVVDLDGAVLAIFTAIPYDFEAGASESQWPDWFMKYVEYGCLERCYGADTDGFIPSLRDYWKQRKEIGFKALEMLKRLTASTDRDFRLGGENKTTRGRGFTLPAGYPAV